MWSGVEKVDSAGGGSQHRDAARLRQLRALRLTLLVAVFAAAPLAAQQEQQRVVRGLSFEGNHAIDDYTLSTAIGTSNSSWFARAFPIRLLGLGEKRSFNELEFRRDVIRLLLLYRQSGYMNAVIDTLVRREGRDVYLKFRIYEGDPVRPQHRRVSVCRHPPQLRRGRRGAPGRGDARGASRRAHAGGAGADHRP